MKTQTPWSTIFIVLGLLILLGAGFIYFFNPFDSTVLPEIIPRAELPEQTTTAPAGTPETQPTTTIPAVTAVPALLPETPLGPVFTLPSVASVADAPRTLYDQLPGQPTRILIPQLGVDAPILAVALQSLSVGGQDFFQWGVPANYAAGWHNTSALLGYPGNTVLNGHHNVNGEIFRDLIDLEIGEEFQLYSLEKAYTYRITDQQLLLERGQTLEKRLENAQWIEPTDDERVTIVTCWPITDNSHRFIVVAEPIP